ncbi:APC membrane recruitment protein 3 [Pelobates fuscus]|uniref:APC membrane recruitment protein 3 n=1 Tax=Pelobates fuscus TaxID=191477 RepID=UPI002FE45C88
MELIRGKTFIKSYAQNPTENVSSCGVKVKKNVDSKRHFNECTLKRNDSNAQGISSRAGVNEERDSCHSRKCITKSKTHDCVTRERKREQGISETEKTRLSSSISFPGDDLRRRNDPQSAYRRHIIDYRNFVPQMPFVPSVAKSLPRKRISLKRSKRGLKDIFSLKKNKQQDVISIAEHVRLGPQVFEMKEGKSVTKQHLKKSEEMDSDELLTHELSDNDMHVDTIGTCNVLCEDVASLKSFDSFTGCGEIFADESSAYIDMEKGKDGPRVMFIAKACPLASNFQGGVERLASPAKSEKIDFSLLCGRAGSSTKSVRPNSLIDNKLLTASNDVLTKESPTVSRDQLSNSTYNDLVSSSEYVTDAGSPVSTSDEGYYDSFSPGTDDDKNVVDTPRSLPRDSYSGDALYELFHESEETKLSPGTDCVVSSLSNHTDNPTSVYSFFVGSEENMASQPDKDLVGDSILQSTWKGKECFLKLCDTELSLTMGLVNWLKKTGKVIEIQETSLNNYCNQTEKQEDIKSPLTISSDSIHESNEKKISMQWQTYEERCSGKPYLANDSEHPKTDNFSTSQQEEPSKCILQCPPQPMSELLSNDQISFLKNVTNSGKHRMDLSNPYLLRLANINSLPLLSNMDVLSCFKHEKLNSLHCHDLQYLKECLSPLLWASDKNVNQMMENCATQVASMHINHRDKNMEQENNVHVEKTRELHNIPHGVKNPTNNKDCRDQQTVPHPTLSITCELGNKHVEFDNLGRTTESAKKISEIVESKNTESEQLYNKECAIKKDVRPSLAEGSKPQWFNTRTNFLPLFGSRCSSVISDCPSTLYKVCNTGETVIFLNTKKCDEPFCSTENITQGSNVTFHVESSRNTATTFQTVTAARNGFTNSKEEVK